MPPPRLNLVRYHGVLAPNAANRRQIVFWQCENGGESTEHVHDFWEYAVVIEGSFDGTIADEVIHMEPGDECVIPPGVKHSGHYSTGYRAIDAFSARRVTEFPSA